MARPEQHLDSFASSWAWCPGPPLLPGLAPGRWHRVGCPPRTLSRAGSTTAARSSCSRTDILLM